jgi:predicted TIM-barrel fold metal-dependent hydrolase
VIDQIGDGVLMYSSDYNHGECWFPVAVDTIMAWDMSDEVRKKFLWENATRLYRRYSGAEKLAAANGIEL